MTTDRKDPMADLERITGKTDASKSPDTLPSVSIELRSLSDLLGHVASVSAKTREAIEASGKNPDLSTHLSDLEQALKSLTSDHIEPTIPEVHRFEELSAFGVSPKMIELFRKVEHFQLARIPDLQSPEIQKLFTQGSPDTILAQIFWIQIFPNMYESLRTTNNGNHQPLFMGFHVTDRDTGEKIYAGCQVCFTDVPKNEILLALFSQLTPEARDRRGMNPTTTHDLILHGEKKLSFEEGMERLVSFLTELFQEKE